jgi:hypothetical protein
MSVCGLCKKPFVAWQKANKENPTATWRQERCPECAPHRLGRQGATLDCYEYMRQNRLTARLRDGYNILTGRGA